MASRWLLSRRVAQLALAQVAQQLAAALEVVQAVLAEEELLLENKLEDVPEEDVPIVIDESAIQEIPNNSKEGHKIADESQLNKSSAHDSD